MDYILSDATDSVVQETNKFVRTVLDENSRRFFGFTKDEFDKIIQNDILNIICYYYSQMDMRMKHAILNEARPLFRVNDIEDIFEELMDEQESYYIPNALKLIDRITDDRITAVKLMNIVFGHQFSVCCKLCAEIWNKSYSYSNYLTMLNISYFSMLSKKYHVTARYGKVLSDYYGFKSYDVFSDQLAQLADGWDFDVDYEVISELVSNNELISETSKVGAEECQNAVSYMEALELESLLFDIDDDEIADGFELLLKRTQIVQLNNKEIDGFDCHFCEGDFGKNEYIIVYQSEDKRFVDIIDTDNWHDFQKKIYKEDIKLNHNAQNVYIIYILDNDTDNIPIQAIESNKTYGRKYAFSEEEAISFINGIINTSKEDIDASSPVHEWDRILKEVHLSGCLTEAYSSKKVENYLSGQRFDADYGQDDYSSITKSKIPCVKWIKSLDTSGFRDFCFDDAVMDFGQINLFYGANGSGKTSVLEAIEYSLTSEVRRVKDFKVKMPSGLYPRLKVYDHEAGIHSFYPDFSKRNTKEIERIWYGVPVGRTKTNLNENFNRFNAFDSEAAYKFIHESDNSEDSFSSMFGNLMFGESVVDHEKKWQRYKKAFDDRYSELRKELNEAKYYEDLYRSVVSNKNEVSKSTEVEEAIDDLDYQHKDKLPRETEARYKKLLEDMSMIVKYVNILKDYELDEFTFDEIYLKLSEEKKKNVELNNQKKDKQASISQIAEENGEIKKQIHLEENNQIQINSDISSITTEIRNWEIVQRILDSTDTLELVDKLTQELSELQKKIYNISKVEQRTEIISFLNLDSYEPLVENELNQVLAELETLKNRKQQLERDYNDKKRLYGINEQKLIELRKIGKSILSEAKCPLCGQQYDSTEQLIDIIDNAIVLDDGIDSIISKIHSVGDEIQKLERFVEREEIISNGITEISRIYDVVPEIAEFGNDYQRLFEYVESKISIQRRIDNIIEQQKTLDSQGFSLVNISRCKQYKNNNPTYLNYKREGGSTYSSYLNTKLLSLQSKYSVSENRVNDLKSLEKKNAQNEEELRFDIKHIDSMIDELNMSGIRSIEQALESIKLKFTLPMNVEFGGWQSDFQDLFDKCEYEADRIASQSSLEFEREQLKEYSRTVKILEPMVTRCAKAVQVFETMPTLSSFVEKGIENNLQLISKLFMSMHHSGEFTRLDIDENGIYAVRGLNDEKVRTYQMSTGQRATIAMAVMFALHIAAPNAPQFLLLDEPLATMDDTQVMNVLEIIKSLAEKGTQIFFTTANGIMIDLFKSCFKNTLFDYKEYEFVKRINSPSEIIEHSINDTKSIEELTLEDLTLDFNQFAQIREILKRNQAKLVTDDDEIEDDEFMMNSDKSDYQSNEDDTSFYSLLSSTEITLLNILINQEGCSSAELISALSPYPSYKMVYESINEKAVDFFGETIVENNDALPWMDEEYISELTEQYSNFLQRIGE